jgi:uncharacterized protein YdhG (YjbR/CyaY superfamily)
MEIFEEFLSKIENELHRLRTKEILNWVHVKYPQLVPKVAWNQPMFTDHGTFIIAFSVAKNHLAMTPEKAGIERFSDEIEKSGYSYSSMIARIPWKKPVDYDLIAAMIEFNLEDKKDCMTFWRKP